MPRHPRVELDPDQVERTVRRFRYHRPTVFGQGILDKPQQANKEPYQPYDLAAAAVDELGVGGAELMRKGRFLIKMALEEAARKRVPDADKILERREEKAKKMNKDFREAHGIN